LRCCSTNCTPTPAIWNCRQRWVIAHVAQETPALPTPALEFVLDGDAELRQIERDLHAAEIAHDGTLQAELHARFDAIGGYSARARAGKLMDGLGFATAQLEQSGGGILRRLAGAAESGAGADVPLRSAAAGRTD
jgi:ATPase subunit of ABC transporter with duplicated ATPase domains